MSQASSRHPPQEPACEVRGQELIAVCDAIAKRYGVVHGAVSVKLVRGVVVGVELKQCVCFALSQEGESRAELLTAAVSESRYLSTEEVKSLRTEFDAVLRPLIYHYGTATLNVVDGKAEKIIFEAHVLRGETTTLGLMLAGEAGPSPLNLEGGTGATVN